MTALKSRDIDAFLAKPDPRQPIILLYGPDAGLVRERADALIASAVDDTNDPFSLVKIDGDELASEPSRLVDEAMTVPLFGGRRAIRIRAGGRNFSSGVQTLTQTPPLDCRIVIEAGDLRRDAPLRKICESAKSAVAIPCYADGPREIARMIDDELKEAKLRLSADARPVLTALLGADRQASRNEVRKLTLYAHGKDEITLDDVLAVVTDASEPALDAIVDNAFAGKPAEVETAFSKAMTAGLYPGAIISAAQRQAAQLHRVRVGMDKGQGPMDAMATGFPRLHFSRTALIETALRNWTSEKLLRAIGQLAEAAIDSRRRSMLATAVAQRALLAVASAGRARS
jgi:DNA polymerase-3 subunit delta